MTSSVTANGNSQAFPGTEPPEAEVDRYNRGLTKKEYMATHIMCALLNRNFGESYSALSTQAELYAEALLNALAPRNPLKETSK